MGSILNNQGLSITLELLGISKLRVVGHEAPRGRRRLRPQNVHMAQQIEAVSSFLLLSP